MFEGIDTLNQSDENKGKNNTANKAEHTSELSQVVTATAFEKAYAAFIDQADKNASSGKTQGLKRHTVFLRSLSVVESFLSVNMVRGRLVRHHI